MILGVVGELLGDAGIFEAGDRLQEITSIAVGAANERAGVATKRAAQAELRLEQLRKDTGPRAIAWGAFATAIKGQPAGNAEILYLRDVPDALSLADTIRALLISADRKVALARPNPDTPATSSSPTPLAMTVGGQPSGITVVASRIPVDETAPLTKEYGALMEALSLGLDVGIAEVYGGRDPTMPEGLLRIVVGPRP